MFLNTTITEWLAGASISSTIDAFTDRSTKIRLQRARQRRQDRAPISEEICYDNSLFGKMESIYSLERIKNANIIGWRYWAQGRGSSMQRSSLREFSGMDLGSAQFWSVMHPDKEPSFRPESNRLPLGIELEASLIAGSQKTRAVGDYVLRNQADLAQWNQMNNSCEFVERIPISHRLEMR